jgi:hypothetical protein
VYCMSYILGGSFNNVLSTAVSVSLCEIWDFYGCEDDIVAVLDCPEDGGRMFLRNVGIHPRVLITSQTRRNIVR